MTLRDAESLLVLLHGVGAWGYDLAPLGEALVQALPRSIFAAPDAPFPFDRGPGRQWFSVTAVTPDNRPQRVAAARQAFDRVVSDVIDESGFSGRLDRVVLVGFSQGTIMALDAVATGRWPVGAVVGFSGRLASAGPPTPTMQTRVLLVHGAEDPVVLPAETAHAAAVLSGLGVLVESHILPSVGHVVAPEGVALAVRFLAGILGPAS